VKSIVQCYRAYYVIKVFILWSWQKHFLRLCKHNIYIYICSMFIIEHYIHIQMYTWYAHRCICTRTGSTHGVHGLVTGLASSYPIRHGSKSTECWKTKSIKYFPSKTTINLHLYTPKIILWYKTVLLHQNSTQLISKWMNKYINKYIYIYTYIYSQTLLQIIC
jgi:hypothetical protein